MGRTRGMTRIKQSAAEKRAIREKKEILIEAALENDATTRKELARQTGLKQWEVNEVLHENKELWVFVPKDRVSIKPRKHTISLAINAVDNVLEVKLSVLSEAHKSGLIFWKKSTTCNVYF